MTLVQIVDQMAFLFVDDAEFADRTGVVGGRRAHRPDRGGARRGRSRTSSTCDWTLDAIDLQPVTEALGIKARKAMPAVYAAVEGVHRGAPAVRLDVPARARTHPRAAARGPRPLGLSFRPDG